MTAHAHRWPKHWAFSGDEPRHHHHDEFGSHFRFQFEGPPFGRGRGRGRRRRPKGDVRAAILLLLEEQPRNGYALMQEIEERSEGEWRPSPGSVYPALQLLQDEGLITETEQDGKRAFALTDAGRAHVEEHREHMGTPWEDATRDRPEGTRGLVHEFQGIARAMRQVLESQDADHIEKATKLLSETRRGLHRIMAGDQ